VRLKHELDPSAQKEPIEDSGRPAIHETLPSAPGARKGNQQRSKRDRRQKIEIELREDEQQEDGTQKREQGVESNPAIERMNW